ncbi:MAG: NAD(P)/FAD-dependent oxidoreductase [candidate division WOR-3 bacterium]|nr:MAG: NAD(P)/FAD-dependent oxidoreductase [candidate division WOR-3 bacterium]
MAERSIIIIGAGMAGLSAGCYARMNGYKTRIFELHNLPGGLCTSWKRKGYTIDGCIHWLTGSSWGTLYRVYEELGAVQGRQMVDHEVFVRVESDGKTFIVYNDIDRLEQHMKELAPGDAGVIGEFCNALRVLAGREMPSDKPIELMGLVDKLRATKALSVLKAMHKYGRVSIQQFAARFTDPFMREVFPEAMANMPDLSISGLMMALAYGHGRNAGYPVGGSLEFSKAIERRYLGLGGEIRYKARVERVLVENNSAVGVRLADGTEHRADVVVSAADGRTTIFDMLGGRYVDDSIRRYYDKWPVYEGFLQVSLGVAHDFSAEPQSLAFRLDDPVQVGDQSRHWMQMRHFCYDPTMAPEGKSVVIATYAFTNPEYWNKLYADQEKYRAEKQALADAVIDRLDKRFPGFREKVEVVDVATPVTFERYTGNWKGSYMGWMATPATEGTWMKRTLPGLANFYMAGQWVFMGGGVPGAILSGRHAMQVICKKDGKKFRTSTP